MNSLKRWDCTFFILFLCFFASESTSISPVEVCTPFDASITRTDYNQKRRKRKTWFASHRVRKRKALRILQSSEKNEKDEENWDEFLENNEKERMEDSPHVLPQQMKESAYFDH